MIGMATQKIENDTLNANQLSNKTNSDIHYNEDNTLIWLVSHSSLTSKLIKL